MPFSFNLKNENSSELTNYLLERKTKENDFVIRKTKDAKANLTAWVSLP